MKGWRFISLAATVWLAAGCAGNQINYNQASSQLELGMSKQQVRLALGDPRRTDVTQERERWFYWNPTMYGFTPIDNEALAADRLVVTFSEGKVSQWGNQTFQADAMEMSQRMIEAASSQQPYTVQAGNVN